MSRTKRVLILGGGVMQLPAIRAARRKGWRVVVADANPDAPGAGEADRFERVDLKDLDGMTRLAAVLAAEEAGLSGVFTAGTDFSATVAWVARKVGLPGLPYEVAQRCTDKVLMRRALRKACVPSPPFALARDADAAVAAGRRIGFPLVVKPVDNMGSRGVRRVDTVPELAAAAERALGLSRTGRAIVEAYVEGKEFSLDAVVYDGEIQVCGCADRHIYFPPYFVEMGHTMPSDESPERVAAIRATFRRGIRALGITNGAAKGDVKLSATGPVIGEIAARLSGGYMSGWTYPYASGVDVTGAALEVAVGSDPGDLTPKRNHTSAERAFISIPGTVGEILGLAEAERSVCDIFVRATPGDRVSFPLNNVEKCGNVIAAAPTRQEAVLAAETARRRVFIRLRPGDEATEAFLFRRLPPHAPDAFSVRRRENREALDAVLPVQLEEGAASIRPLCIRPVPSPALEDATDWHGGTLSQALERVVELTGLRIGRAEGYLDVSGPVWTALLRGGAQGAVWVVDTIRQRQQAHRPLAGLAARWRGEQV